MGHFQVFGKVSNKSKFYKLPTFILYDTDREENDASVNTSILTVIVFSRYIA
jgi:hypothetical protein